MYTQKQDGGAVPPLMQRGRNGAPPLLHLIASALALAASGVVGAQSAPAVDVAEVLKQIEALRAEQTHIAEMQARTEATIRALEASLERERDSTRRFAAAALLQDLKTRLQ